MLFYIVHKQFPWAHYFTVILYLLPQQLSDGVEGNYLFSSTCLFYAIHKHKVAQGTEMGNKLFLPPNIGLCLLCNSTQA